MDEGGKPETYVHMLNGTEVDGVFLGRGNVTSWGFKFVAERGLYTVRLLTPDVGGVSGLGLKDGEVAGFLKAVYPY